MTELKSSHSDFIRLYFTPLSTLYNSLILKGLKFNSFLAKNCKPSIYRALEKRVESQVYFIKIYWYILSSCNDDKKLGVRIKLLYTPNIKD